MHASTKVNEWMNTGVPCSCELYLMSSSAFLNCMPALDWPVWRKMEFCFPWVYHKSTNAQWSLNLGNISFLWICWFLIHMQSFFKLILQSKVLMQSTSLTPLLKFHCWNIHAHTDTIQLWCLSTIKEKFHIFSLWFHTRQILATPTLASNRTDQYFYLSQLHIDTNPCDFW